MTEKEKMLAGLAYDSRDPELLGRYYQARAILRTFNGSDIAEEKTKAMDELFADVGADVWIESPFFCDYGDNITIGANTFINYNCIFIDDNLITIGANCLLGPHVQLYTAEHPLHAGERIIGEDGGKTRYITTTKPIVIGDNVWIGGNVVVLPGITIGNNVTIGAGAVVTKSIADNCVAVGNPARVVKSL
ncbi:sugar O-acetyltransferase [Culicoidibacter larvae]|uniref:Sugar O-acetyltransferase n=1 Tax=Culicoidibacter larvae TaxID=2579976 RepID=A0A5R8QB81_9FIRM|nr:sugar O-acetyltransferase [Culicoidibacter larvae]TLG72885.1 sugar O-acetyltransferase [Culicoidibacter larvae]